MKMNSNALVQLFLATTLFENHFKNNKTFFFYVLWLTTKVYCGSLENIVVVVDKLHLTIISKKFPSKLSWVGHHWVDQYVLPWLHTNQTDCET